ncbi:MAG: TetR/AcrR family transcriptional regulator [Candidatus Eisenbacteria bacterium]|nr:TetR/AcrR family transcriptional regulator [Candidatus Eisenbacteria bacterium]
MGVGGQVACQGARDRILTAAARLHALRGYDGTSVREIAEAAGVTKPLIYYYFPSKETLFATLLHDAVEFALSGAREILLQEGSPRRQFIELIRSQVALAREFPEIYAFVHEALTMPGPLPLGFDYRQDGRRLIEVFHRVVEEGRRAGEFRDVPPEVVVAMPLAVLGIYVAKVLAGEIPAIPERMEESLSDLVLRGAEARACQ